MLYNLQALMNYTGFTREADVKSWLEECGIKWWRGKGGQPLTTLTQIDAGLSEEKNWDLDHGR